MSKIDLNRLNPQQKEAAIHKDGPLLILAGAGSGKTATTIERIGYLMSEHKIDPFNILAVTFTNKAALEMKERAMNIVGNSAKKVTIATFHSFCAKRLRIYAKHIEGYNNKFSIITGSDNKTIIKNILKEFELSEKENPPSLFLSYISGFKNELLSPKDVEVILDWLKNPMFKELELPIYIDKDKAQSVVEAINEFNPMLVLDIYREYQKQLKELNCFDFDDLIFQMTMLLINNMEVLNEHQERFRYVMVDEYQDTNHAQYILMKLIVAKYKNIYVVGDDYQCIYGFRNADIRNILEFEKDYKGAKVVKLEQNYRSNEPIITAANRVIKNNIVQMHKNLWTLNKGGPAIIYKKFDDYLEEANFVVEKINMLLKFSPQNEIAILYRTNGQAVAFEDALNSASIPYKMVGLSFFNRAEVKDIMAYLNFIQNEDDTLSLSRIINKPSRGIGNKTIEKIAVFSQINKISIWEGFQRAEEILKGKTLEKVVGFRTFIEEMKMNSEIFPLDILINTIIEESNYKEDLLCKLKKEVSYVTSDKVDEKINNLYRLSKIAQDFEDNFDIEELEEGITKLDLFVENIALNSNDSGDSEEDEPKVTLMTIHASKGLEFPVVFLVGLSEQILPHANALFDHSGKGLEEERRLCYVGITRAKQMLFLTHSERRVMYGNPKMLKPSRFLVELGYEKLTKKSSAILPW